MDGTLANDAQRADLDGMFSGASNRVYGYGAIPPGIMRGLLAEQAIIREYVPSEYQKFYLEHIQALNNAMHEVGVSNFGEKRWTQEGEEGWYFNLNLRQGTETAIHGLSSGFISIAVPKDGNGVEYTKSQYAKRIAHVKMHELLHQLIRGISRPDISKKAQRKRLCRTLYQTSCR